MLLPECRNAAMVLRLRQHAWAAARILPAQLRHGMHTFTSIPSLALGVETCR